MNERDVKLKIKLKQSDFLILQIRAFMGSIIKVLSIIAMFALFGLMVWSYSKTGKNFFLVFITFIPVVVYLSFFVYYIPKDAAEKYMISSYSKRELLFSIDLNMLTIERDNGNISEMLLKDLSSAWEKIGYFYFFITKNNTIILPKRLLSKVQVKDIHNILLSLPKGKKRNPYGTSLLRLIINIFIFLVTVLLITFFIVSLSTPSI